MGAPSQEFLAQSPTYHKWVPVFGSTVSELKLYTIPGFPSGLFLYRSHPITHIELTGHACSVSRVETPTNKISFVLDDGSGISIPVFWFTDQNVPFETFEGNIVTVLGRPSDLFGQVVVKASDVSVCCQYNEVLAKTMATINAYLGILSYNWTPLFQTPNEWTEDLMEEFQQLELYYCSFDKSFDHKIPQLYKFARIKYPEEGCVALELRDQDDLSDEDNEDDEDIEEISESQFRNEHLINKSHESIIESDQDSINELISESAIELSSEHIAVRTESMPVLSDDSNLELEEESLEFSLDSRAEESSEYGNESSNSEIIIDNSTSSEIIESLTTPEFSMEYTPMDGAFIENPNEFLMQMSPRLRSTPQMSPASGNTMLNDMGGSEPRVLDNPMALIADLLDND